MQLLPGFSIVAAAPELLGGAAVIGTAGLVTGVPASIGAIVLLVVDELVFGGEMTGHEVLSKKIEDNKTIQWMRIGATIMLLPDIAVGGVRALKEIGALGSEAREAEEASKLARGCYEPLIWVDFVGDENPQSVSV